MTTTYKHTSNLAHYDITDKIHDTIEYYQVELFGLSEAKILLTGGSGFFGTWLLAIFAEAYHRSIFRGEIYIVTRNKANFLINSPELASLPFVVLIEGSIIDVDISHLEPDHLIHFASVSAAETFDNVDQLIKIDTLYLGTKNILEQCGNTLKKVLFTSSGVAYGPTEPNIPIRESHYCRVNTTDSSFSLCLGKINAEFLIHLFSQKFGFRFSIARCFSFCGEFMPLSMHYAFGNFILDAEEQRSIQLASDGSAQRSYMYVGDAIGWLLTLLSDPKNDVYNVGSDESITIRELACLIAEAGGVEVSESETNIDRGNFLRSAYLPDINKITKAYPHLRQVTSLSSVVSRMLSRRISK